MFAPTSSLHNESMLETLAIQVHPKSLMSHVFCRSVNPSFHFSAGYRPFCIGCIILCYFKFCLWSFPFSLSFPCSLKILVQERKLKALPSFRFSCKWGKRARGKEIETYLLELFSFYCQAHITFLSLTLHCNSDSASRHLVTLDLFYFPNLFFFFLCSLFLLLQYIYSPKLFLRLFAGFTVFINFQKISTSSRLPGD